MLSRDESDDGRGCVVGSRVVEKRRVKFKSEGRRQTLQMEDKRSEWIPGQKNTTVVEVRRRESERSAEDDRLLIRKAHHCN